MVEVLQLHDLEYDLKCYNRVDNCNGLSQEGKDKKKCVFVLALMYKDYPKCESKSWFKKRLQARIKQYGLVDYILWALLDYYLAFRKIGD